MAARRCPRASMFAADAAAASAARTARCVRSRATWLGIVELHRRGQRGRFAEVERDELRERLLTVPRRAPRAIGRRRREACARVARDKRPVGDLADQDVAEGEPPRRSGRTRSRSAGGRRSRYRLGPPSRVSAATPAAGSSARRPSPTLEHLALIRRAVSSRASTVAWTVSGRRCERAWTSAAIVDEPTCSRSARTISPA